MAPAMSKSFCVLGLKPLIRILGTSKLRRSTFNSHFAKGAFMISWQHSSNVQRAFAIAIFHLAFVGLSGAGAAPPQQILILRHGEKPKDHSDVHLDHKGRLRAKALHELFEKSSRRPDPFQRPDFIFAAADSDQSHRPRLTVEPLAEMLKLNVNLSFPSDVKGVQDLAKEILGHERYAGKTVLICWHHGRIPELAHALKAAEAPKTWDGESVFDRVWVIRYGKQDAAKFIDLPQRLMPYDEDAKVSTDAQFSAVAGTVSGKVQQVGFRAMILRQAITFNLAGKAFNNADPGHTVSFVLQGDSARIHEAVAMIKKGTKTSEDVKVVTIPGDVDPGLKTFTVIDWTSKRANITTPYQLKFTVRTDGSIVSKKEADDEYHAILERTLSTADWKKVLEKGKD